MKADMRHAQIEHRPNGGQLAVKLGTRWEYRTCKMDAGDDLSQYGGDGWELVSVVANIVDPGTVTAYLKRPI